MPRYRIGALAEATGYTVEAIRYYERERLLPAPARTQANNRLYDDMHLSQLQFIRHCRSLDMGLDEIRTLLGFRAHPELPCDDVNALLDRRIVQVAQRIAQLQALEQQLQQLRALCPHAHTADDCAILHHLASPEQHGKSG